jgi:hypothetical protein
LGGATRTISGPRQGFNILTGADGRFEIAGLTKGTYDLKIEAPGQAWQGPVVWISPDLKSAELEVALERGDSISGLVHDRDGRPVAGLTVDPKTRHEVSASGLDQTIRPSGAEPVVTDTAGRFRMDSLLHGRYTLEISGPGIYKILKEVPAGSANLDVTLERPKSP